MAEWTSKMWRVLTQGLISLQECSAILIRDGLKQKKIVEEFLFFNSTWIVDTIDAMLGKTKRKKGAKLRVRKRRDNKNNKSKSDAPPLVDCQGNPIVDGGGDMILEAGDGEDEREEGNPNKVESEDEENEGESMDCVAAGLTDREVSINTNTNFHTFN